MHNIGNCVMQGSVVLIPSVRLADGFFGRALGLMGKRPLEPGTGLLIKRCRAIHTCFMRFAIDAFFMDRTGRVVRAVFNLPPWRFARGGLDAVDVLETRTGWLRREDLDPDTPWLLTRRPLGKTILPGAGL